MKLLIFLFLIAFVSANLIVKHFGAWGLLFSSFLLIPFDFITRCIIHEKYTGARLIGLLTGLTLAASVITYAINRDALSIALGSIAGFIAAQVFAGIYYQTVKSSSNYFFKVNLSDLIAIVFDSIAFQIVAFQEFNVGITFGQICIKFAGGVMWYLILFKWLKVHEKILGKTKGRYHPNIMKQHLTALGYFVSKEGKVVGAAIPGKKADSEKSLLENYLFITENTVYEKQ